MPRFLAPSLALLASAALAAPSPAKPPSAEVAQQQATAVAELAKRVTDEPTPAGKADLVRKAMAGEADPDVRRRILSLANGIQGPEAEALWTGVLAADADAGIRGDAATALGKTGSERCLAALAAAAANDAETDVTMGCIRGRGTARRQATFAIAELAGRFPALAADAATRLRALPAARPPPDNEGLADARVQALFQLTRDDALLAPFRDRLKSGDPKVREAGVVAFRFLKLKAAPPEVRAALKDPDVGVRQWAALVLGEIGDPATTEALKATAADPAEDAGVRANAAFGLRAVKR